MKSRGHGFQYGIGKNVRAGNFPIGQIFKTYVVWCLVKICVKGGGWITTFFNSVSIQVVPRILPNSAYTLWCMIRLVMTCGNRGSIAN